MVVREPEPLTSQMESDFPEDYTPKQKTDLIEQLLKEWYEKQEYSKQESLGSSRGRVR